MTVRCTVIIATYRRSGLVCRAVESVLAQTFPDFELVVVDDNGVGHPEQLATVQALNSRFVDSRLIYRVNPESLGCSGARNAGLAEARGEFVAFLDDDEQWLPEKLARQLAMMDTLPAGVALLDTGFYDMKPGRRHPREVRPKMQGQVFEQLLAKTAGRAPKLSTVLVRRSALDEVGGFDIRMPAREDLDLYIRLARQYEFASLPEPLARKCYDANSARLSRNPAAMLKGSELLYRKIEADLQTHPRDHAVFLLRFARELSRAGETVRARQYLLRAYRLWRKNPRLLSYAPRILLRR